MVRERKKKLVLFFVKNHHIQVTRLRSPNKITALRAILFSLAFTRFCFDKHDTSEQSNGDGNHVCPRRWRAEDDDAQEGNRDLVQAANDAVRRGCAAAEKPNAAVAESEAGERRHDRRSLKSEVGDGRKLQRLVDFRRLPAHVR